MSTLAARKNGQDLAVAWLRREPKPAQDARRHPSQQPTTEEAATRRISSDRTRGFFRA